VIARRTQREVDILRQANQIVADTLVAMAEMIRPGITTFELDLAAEALIRQRGGVPAFLGYRGYPNATCISVDDVVVHGIPGDRRLADGEIVSMDVGVIYKGYHGDAAVSVPCREVSKEKRRLLDAADRALANGIAAARAGNYLEDISRAIEETCRAEGFSVVRAFVGHGIGTRLHEEPQIPNFVTGERGPRLRSGMVLAIEPMVNLGVADIRVLDDGWTAVTADGNPSAHFEHSVVVRDGEPDILSMTSKRVWGQLRTDVGRVCRKKRR